MTMQSTLHTHVTSVLAEMLESRNFNGVAVNWNQVEADTHAIEAVCPQRDHIFNIGVGPSSITVKVGEVDIPTSAFGDTADLTVKNINSIAQAVADISSCMGLGISASSFVINSKSGNAVMYHPYDIDAVNKLRDLIDRAQAAGCPLSKEQIKVMLGNMRESSAIILRNYLTSIRCKEKDVDTYMSPVSQGAIIDALARGGASEGSGNTHLFTMDSALAESITAEQATKQERESAIEASQLMSEGADDAFALIPLSALFSFRVRQPIYIALMVRQTSGNELLFAAFLLVEEEGYEGFFEGTGEPMPVLISCYDHLGDFLEVEIDEEDEGAEDESPLYYVHWTTTFRSILQDRSREISDYIIALLNGTQGLGGNHSEYIKSNRSNISQTRYRTGVMTAIHNQARP